MTEEFGLSENDQLILNRLKNNREAKKEDAEDEVDKIEPIIKYGVHRSKEEKKAAVAEKAKETRLVKKMKKESEQSIKKKAIFKGSMSPKVEYVDDTVIFKWTRSARNNHILLPDIVEMGDVVKLKYNSKTKELLVTTAQDSHED